MNYNDALNYIHSLQNFGKEPTLERIKAVLEKLGNPQNNFKAIHIAGTNGKGSVSAMLHSVFKTAGYKTGLFISPYIIDFRERIQINGEFIPENDLCRLSQNVIETEVELTQFEFITAVAFLYFAEQKCDIVIAETGLGGRLDATNILSSVKASIITKIGLDHTAILGDSIEKITREKCGIIKNAPVITSFNQPSRAQLVLSEYKPIIPQKDELRVTRSDIFGNEFIYKDFAYKTTLSGEHQIENATIVIETASICGIETAVIQKGIESTHFPARLELISKKPLVVLDGAHNPDGASALARVMEEYDGKIAAIIGMCEDKDCQEVLKQTLGFCKKAITVSIKGMPRSIEGEKLAALAREYCETVDTAKDYDEALDKVKDEKCIFVFGSLYLASAIRDKIKNFFKD